jgi:hypothetical protein
MNVATRKSIAASNQFKRGGFNRRQKGYPLVTSELKPEAAAAGATGKQAPQAAPPIVHSH